MKAAFACWDERIAPVFDTARRIHTVEVESGRIVREAWESINEDDPGRKALRLAELAIDTLVCGAISRQLSLLVCAHGIRVIPFVAGGRDEVVKAWLGGSLTGKAYAMPGCRGCGIRGYGGGSSIGREGRYMPGNRGSGRGAGGGQGRRQGRGCGRGPVDVDTGSPAGGKTSGEESGTCVCHQCGHREPREPGLPCRTRICPRCGGAMRRES